MYPTSWFKFCEVDNNIKVTISNGPGPFPIDTNGVVQNEQRPSVASNIPFAMVLEHHEQVYRKTGPPNVCPAVICAAGGDDDVKVGFWKHD